MPGESGSPDPSAPSGAHRPAVGPRDPAGGPLVRCGAFSHLPAVDHRCASEARQCAGNSDAGACRRLGRLGTMYRCVQCGRWMHRACLRAHFRHTLHDRC